MPPNRRRRLAVVFLAVAVVAGAVVLRTVGVRTLVAATQDHSVHRRGPVAIEPSSNPAAPATPARAAGSGTRVIVLVEENHESSQIVGSRSAPFLNSLVAAGTLLSSYYGIRHPSLPNYLALLGGDTFGIHSDCTGCRVHATNLVDQLEAAHISWRGYFEGLPGPCSDAAFHGSYAKKHNPFMYFDDIRQDPARCRNVPTVLCRTDGRALLYRGRMHFIAGEPESGKSWLAQLAAAEQLQAGQDVLYLDFEDSAVAVVRRLRALGCTDAQIQAHLRYVQPVEPLMSDRLPAALLLAAATLALIDGVTACLSLLHLNGNDNADVALFIALLPRPLAQAGAATVVIDHVPKAHDSRGRFPLGAQHKLAAIDGAAYMVTPVKPFGFGQEGLSRIEVVKDRPGRVREHATFNSVGELHLSSEGGAVRAEIRPAARGSNGSFRPTVLMARVSDVLADSDEALSTREVLAAVIGKKEFVAKALDALVDEGNVVVAPGRQGSKRHTLVRPFSEAS